MKTIDNTFKSKVMKAAWKTFKKRSKWSFSACLKNAWEWAKKTLLKDFEVWSPREGFGRVYFGENKYMQYSIKERSAKGYYESHRACKGSTFATAYYKLQGVTFEEIEEFLSRIEYQISDLGQNLEFVASKF